MGWFAFELMSFVKGESKHLVNDVEAPNAPIPEPSEKNKCTKHFLCVFFFRSIMRDAYLSDIFTIAIFLSHTSTTIGHKHN